MIGVSMATTQHTMVVQPAKEIDVEGRLMYQWQQPKHAMVVQPAKEISTN